MYNVLIPVDDNLERAIAQAEYVSALPAPADGVDATILTVGMDDFSATEAPVRAAEHLESAGIDVDRVVEEGGVARAIVEAAAERETDHLVMGGRKRSDTATALLGSTVLDVFRSTDLPVTMTGQNMTAGNRDRHLLLPVDDDEERAGHQADFVTGLPGDPGEVTATVLVVFRHQDYKGAPEHTFDEVDAAVLAADRLAAAGVPVERVAVGGEIPNEILDTAADHGATEIVMGGRKRSGVQKVLMGSTARDVLLSADRPVTITG